MSWLGIVVAAVAIYVGFKVIGLLLRLALWAVALAALYWFAAPYLGWPAPAELLGGHAQVLDAGRMGDAIRHSEAARDAAGAAIDHVAGQVRAQIGDGPAAERGDGPQPLPAPPDDGEAASDPAAIDAPGAEGRGEPDPARVD